MTKTLKNGTTIEVSDERVMFAHRLLECLEGVKMSRKALAARLGVHPNTIDNWITYRSEPGLSSLVDIAKVFGVSIDWLLYPNADKEGER